MGTVHLSFRRVSILCRRKEAPAQSQGPWSEPPPQPGHPEKPPVLGREAVAHLHAVMRVADRPGGQAPRPGLQPHDEVPVRLRPQPPTLDALLSVLFSQPSTGVRPAMPPSFLQPSFLCPRL